MVASTRATLPGLCAASTIFLVLGASACGGAGGDGTTGATGITTGETGISTSASASASDSMSGGSTDSDSMSGGSSDSDSMSGGSSDSDSMSATDSASASATDSDSDSDSDSASATDTDPSGSNGSEGDPKWDLGEIPDSAEECGNGGGGGGGDDVLSYIWIANSSQGTVSKINTLTGIEEGRYDSLPAEGGNPSRTSVNLLGDVAVSNRHPGGVTKIASNIDNCIDKNNNNQIETSTGPNDVLPWDQDECVLWHTPTPTSSYGNGPRPTAWEGGKFSEGDGNCGVDENPRLWIGFKADNSDGVFWRLDGETGELLDEVNFGYWGSSYGPYGGAVNAEGDLVVTGLNTDPSIHIDEETLVATDLGNPANNCKYGMGLDQNGDLWVGHCFGEGVSHYSFETEQWTTIPNPGGTRVNGIQADRNGNVWGAGSSPCRLVQIDVDTKQYINANIPLPGGCSSPWGVSVDVEGFVWIVDMGASKAYKVNPETYQTELEVTGLIGPYTYSDMTGSGLNLVVNPPG